MFRPSVLRSAAVLFLAVVGCTDTEKKVDELLEPPPPGKGVQYKMVTNLEPGEEDERCKFVVSPPGGLWVNFEQVRNSAGSHHIFVWKTPYAEIPTVNKRGEPVDTTDVFKCSDGVSADWDVDAVVAGGQQASAGQDMELLPEGVALQIPEGTVLVLFGHFLNPQDVPIEAEVRVNFFTVPRETVTTEAAIYVHYNPFIRVGAMATADARMSCPVPEDITILGAQSHMHARGMGLDASLVHADGTSEPLYQSKSWDDVPVKEWRPGQPAAKGSAIDFTCHYSNGENRVVTQGTSSRDEMCVITGIYYPVNMPFANCSPDGTAEKFSLAATFIGTGSATCAQSLSCINAAKPTSQDKGDSLYGCIVNSCPKVGKQLTGAFMCLAAHGGPACNTACAAGTSTTECKQCTQQACQAPIGACLAATCN